MSNLVVWLAGMFLMSGHPKLAGFALMVAAFLL